MIASGAPAIRQVSFTAGELRRPRRGSEEQVRCGLSGRAAPLRPGHPAGAGGGPGRCRRATGFTVAGVRLRRRRAGNRRGRPRPRTATGRDRRPVRRGRGRARLAWSRARSAPRVLEDRGAAGAASTRTSPGCRWPAIEYHQPTGRSPASFPPTTARPASGSAPRPRTRAARRRIGAAGSRRSPRCSAGRRRSCRRTVALRPADVAGARHARAAQPVRPAYGPGWALVGDAGYHRDAGHRARHQRRVPRRRAARRRARPGVARRGRRNRRAGRIPAAARSARCGRSSRSPAPWSPTRPCPSSWSCRSSSARPSTPRRPALAARPVPGAGDG